MSCRFGDGFAATAADGLAAGCDATAFGGVGAPPWTLIGIASLRSVKYFSLSGSKYENARGGRACFFSFGEITVSKVFAPLIPTSSSCLKRSKGERDRDRDVPGLRGSDTCAFAFTGPISNFPARAAAIAVLNVTTS